MPKTATQFVCQSCGARTPRWAGKCEQCGEWNALVEEAAPAAARRGVGKAVAAGKPLALGTVETTKLPRFGTGSAETDQVLGGGVVPGAVMLLSGDPGIGKSTMVMQIAAHVAIERPVLYVSGEESASQIKLRADRLGVVAENLELLTETNADEVAATIGTGRYGLVIVDSIQTMATEALTGAPGTVGQITASAQILTSAAKRHQAAMLMIGHVTKEGSIAGPKVLEHLVDVVLYLEGDRYVGFKALRGIKNRFGPTSEVGIFEMTEGGLVALTNPSQALLAERQAGPGSVVLAAVEGTRPLLVEVQALASPSSFGYPRRTAVGFDANRLSLLVAVMTKRAHLNLSSHDIYVNIVGGLKVTEPAADLAIILAIASALRDHSLPPKLVTFGEVGLSGEVRSVGHIGKRLEEAKRLSLTQAIGPRFGAPAGLIGVGSIADAITQAFA